MHRCVQHCTQSNQLSEYGRRLSNFKYSADLGSPAPERREGGFRSSARDRRYSTRNERPKHRKPVLLGRASGSYQNGNLSSLANRRRVEGAESLLCLFRLKGHLLSFAEVLPSRRTRYVRDVKKNVFPPIFRRNETESFLGVEEFDRSVLHSSLCFGCPTLHRDKPAMDGPRRRCLGVTVTQFAYDVLIPRSLIRAVPPPVRSRLIFIQSPSFPMPCTNRVPGRHLALLYLLRKKVPRTRRITKGLVFARTSSSCPTGHVGVKPDRHCTSTPRPCNLWGGPVPPVVEQRATPRPDPDHIPRSGRERPMPEAHAVERGLHARCHFLE